MCINEPSTFARMNDDQSKYELRGVSASKEDVHNAIKGMDKGLFPNAFCKILPDIASGDKDYVNIMHADTAGTKGALAYLYWKETGDISVWRGIVQDAVVMNVDDMACAGCVQDIVLSSTIGRNKHLITGDVIAEIIRYLDDWKTEMANLGVRWHLAGGETADVGDIVRTIDVGYTAFGRMKKASVVKIDILPGDIVVGIASYGQAKHENAYNSGIGSNGLTSARHDVLSKYYAANFPESFDPGTHQSVVFSGSRRLTDTFAHNAKEYEVGKLLLSPTRTYVPLIKALLEGDLSDLSGMIHCTGGGQTKVLHFMDKLKVIKEDLLPVPPVFELIQQESGAELREMYQVFNMGHRLEVYCRSRKMASTIMNLAEEWQMDAKIIGTVEPAANSQVAIKSSAGWLHYEG
jgi:phosphoribosylformylglycinamidine cyclo-ligase